MVRANNPEFMTDRDLAVSTNIQASEISKKVDVLSTDVKGLLTKVVVAIIALAGGALGLKFVGSPFLTILGLYIGWIGMFFLAASILMWWKKLGWERIFVRSTFLTFLSISVMARTFIFHSGSELAPVWYGPTIDGLMGLLVVGLIVTIWREK